MPIVKTGRMLVSNIGVTAMSLKRFAKLLYAELDTINTRLEALESLSIESPVVVELKDNSDIINNDLTVDTYKDSSDKEALNDYAVSLGLKSNKNKSVETLISDIDEKLKEVK